jgi:hypothetical protein
LLCSACAGSGLGGLSAGSLAFLNRLLIFPPEQLHRLRWSPAARSEISDSLRLFAEQRLEKTLKAWRQGLALL